jgi:hypothetical protein
MPGSIEEKPFNKVLNQLLANRPDLLKPVYIGDDERFVIYELASQMKKTF